MRVLYEGLIVQVDNGKFHTAILRLTPTEPGCDTIMERECSNEEEANIFIDDEMSRLVSDKGVWDL